MLQGDPLPAARSARTVGGAVCEADDRGRGPSVLSHSGGLRLLSAFTVGLLSVSALPFIVRAQGSPPVDADELINYPYFLHHGFGRYQIADQVIKLFRLPVSVPIRSFEHNGFGLKLRLTVSFGVYELPATALDQIRTAAFLPGIEFQIPIRDNFTLRPFQDLGVGKDLEGGDLVLLSTSGLLTELVFPWKRFEFGFEPMVKYSFSLAPNREFDDEFGVVSLRLDARHPLWFKIGDRLPDVGAYAEIDFYFDELSFPTVDAEPLRVDRHREFGLSFGINPPPYLWILKLSRVSVGYHFGQGLSGIRIRFGDRLTQLPRR